MNGSGSSRTKAERDFRPITAAALCRALWIRSTRVARFGRRLCRRVSTGGPAIAIRGVNRRSRTGTADSGTGRASRRPAVIATRRRFLRPCSRHSAVDAPDLGDELDAATPLLESSEPPVVPDQPPPVDAEVPEEQLPRLVPDEAEDTAAEPLPAPAERAVPEPAAPADSEDPPALPTPPAEALQLEAPPEDSEPSLEESSVTEPDLRQPRSAAKRPEPQSTPETATPSSSNATPVGQRDQPEPESSTPDGPPLPPWHRSAKTGNSPSDEDDSASSPPDDGSEFDPFAGTPFRDTLGLTTVRAHQAMPRRPAGRAAARPCAIPACNRLRMARQSLFSSTRRPSVTHRLAGSKRRRVRRPGRFETDPRL